MVGKSINITSRLTGALKPVCVTIGLLLVVMSLVTPIPAGFLDVGLALSFSSAMLILVMASLVRKPTDFEAFPVFLLVSMALRLALTVSSTRLILANGANGKDAAGQVINGFAEFVAGSSLLVGMTIFSVISVVNFMVITKGAGRMAEVSARFSLDSLPGRQLAIDGDLSSGAITHEEAKERRIREQREISFYGSLDGASKFVRGDAIAGLVITFINLFVGLAVGILIHQMSVADALSTYSHLTIGDGLVTQIPALITSMAAALLLSRGGGSDDTSAVIVQQLYRNWEAPAIVGGGMLIFSAVPGMPSIVFILISCLLFLFSYRVYMSTSGVAPAEEEVNVTQDSVNVKSGIGDLLDVEEVLIEISPDLISSALDEVQGLGARINNLRNHIAKIYGLIVPDIRISDGKDVAIGEYVISIQGVVQGRGKLQADRLLVLGSPSTAGESTSELVHEPVYNTPGYWVDDVRQAEAVSLDVTTVTPMEILSTHLLEIIRRNLAALLTMSNLQGIIQELRSVSDEQRAQQNQKFFDSMMPEKVSPELLLFVLRAMLSEQVSIRNLMMIVEAVYESRGVGSHFEVYEAVRKRLGAQIAEQYLNNEGCLDIVQLHAQWEVDMTRAEVDVKSSSKVSLLKMQKRLSESIKQTLDGLASDGQPVIVVADHRRRNVRSMIEASGLALPVMGFDEVSAVTRVRLIGTVAA